MHAYEPLYVPPPCLVLLQEGQELELDTGHRVRPFPTVHPIPSQVRAASMVQGMDADCIRGSELHGCRRWGVGQMATLLWLIGGSYISGLSTAIDCYEPELLVKVGVKGISRLLVPSPNSTIVAVVHQGYVLYSFRKKLKAELVGKSQEEIKELRLAGQEVTDTYQVGTFFSHSACLPSNA